MFDYLIKEGTIVDGTGGRSYVGDIGIKGNRIVSIGDLQNATAKQMINAKGKVVSPGFIDVHVHSELTLLGGRDQYAPLKMGVTTQLASPDGFSWAPMTGKRLAEQKDYLHVFYEDERLRFGDELSIANFLDYFRDSIPANIALQVPHGPIRVEAMGWEARPATDAEIKKMEQMTEAWMEAGAVAFSTGLEYEPMRWANLEELVRLSKVTRKYGGIYVAHQRGYRDRVSIGCGETFAIAKQAEIPVHISHFTYDEHSKPQFEIAEKEEIPLTFDMYPYPAGCSHLLMALPFELQIGSPKEVIERLHDPAIRQQYGQQMSEKFPLDKVRFSAIGMDHATGWEGLSITEVADQMGLSIADAICEILIQTQLQALMIFHWPEERHPDLKQTFEHPLHMVSTDGIYVGERPHPRGYGTYPKILGEYVRKNNWLTLEQAIYKMTGYPAETFGIKERGFLQEGLVADLVILDPDTVASKANYEKPRVNPTGIENVFVGGHMIIEKDTIHPGLFGQIIT